jgi:tetratricopeptide (TPR) repeat protein
MRRPLLFSALLALACPLAAQNDVDRFLSDALVRQGKEDAGKAKNLDPKRIINESNSFLQEREPEMTAEEYAIYEQVMTMLATNPDFALKLLESLMTDKQAPSPAFEFILGNAHAAAGRTAQAEKSYRSAVDHYPSFVRAWTNLGLLYYTGGRFAEGIPCFSRAVVLGDRTPSTFGLLACCLERTGDTVSAQNAFMQALAGDPLSSDWKEGLLRVYVDSRQFGPAEVVVRSLIKTKPTEARYWLTYANIYLSTNRKGSAIALLAAAASTGVAGPDELSVLGDLYAERNLFPEALATYRKVYAVALPQGERRLIRYAQMQLGAGHFAEAQQALEPLAKTVTADARADFLQARADLFFARKEWPLARRELEALLAADPLNGRALLLTGRTYLAEGDDAHAQLTFESAYRVPGSVYHASLELANLELRQKHYPKVVEYLEKAQTIERTEPVTDLLQQVKALLVTEN